MFVINTPTNTASKFWIGGAAQHGKVPSGMSHMTGSGAHDLDLDRNGIWFRACQRPLVPCRLCG